MSNSVSKAAANGVANALAVDTTSEYLSLAVMKDGRTAAQVYTATGTEMNRTILIVIDRLLKEAGLATEELQLIVAARGPGSFTGTRIWPVSTIQAMKWS